MSDELTNCKNCHKPPTEGSKICGSCEKCIKCRKHYKCTITHKKITHHCPSYKPECKNCGACDKLCKCWFCEKCNLKHSEKQFINHRFNKPCKLCNLCAYLCKCDFCFTCRKVFKADNVCNKCKNCGPHCYCPSVDFTDKGSLTFTASEAFKNNASKRFVAAEIEVAGAQKRSPKAVNKVAEQYKMVIKGDGSLPSGGFEINMSPANGDAWLKEVKDITKALEEQDSFINKQCGLHVHADARDHSSEDIKRLAFLYSKFENELFDLIDAERKRNRYCLPSASHFSKYFAENFDYGGVSMDNYVKNVIFNRKWLNIDRDDPYESKILNSKYDGSRYHALNLQAYYQHKTVECRMHHGSIKEEEIARWGMLWANILDYNKSHSNREIYSLKNDGWDVLKDIVADNEVLKNWINKEAAKHTKAMKPKELRAA